MFAELLLEVLLKPWIKQVPLSATALIQHRTLV